MFNAFKNFLVKLVLLNGLAEIFEYRQALLVVWLDQLSAPPGSEALGFIVEGLGFLSGSAYLAHAVCHALPSQRVQLS